MFEELEDLPLEGATRSLKELKCIFLRQVGGEVTEDEQVKAIEWYISRVNQSANDDDDQRNVNKNEPNLYSHSSNELVLGGRHSLWKHARALPPASCKSCVCVRNFGASQMRVFCRHRGK